MRKLKVWAVATFLPGVYGQVRAIVAATSREKAAEALHTSDHFLSGYASETGNKLELETALGEPGTVFWTPNDNWTVYKSWHYQDPKIHTEPTI